MTDRASDRSYEGRADGSPGQTARHSRSGALANGGPSRPGREAMSGLPARERAYRELRFKILEGRLAPGTTLLETEVATLLSLSRTPIREALIRLEEEGLVTIRPRHGITVSALSLDDLAEIYEVFSALEVKAAALAARRGVSSEMAERMRRLLSGMEQATRQDNIKRWSRLDDEFHLAITRAAGNERLQSTLRLYWDQQYRARVIIGPFRPKPTRSDEEHRAIFDAIVARDEAAAHRLMHQHRERADAQTLELLRTQTPVTAAGGSRDG